MPPPRSEGYVRMPDAEFEAILARAADPRGPIARSPMFVWTTKRLRQASGVHPGRVS